MRRLLKALETRALLIWLTGAGAVWAFVSLGGEVTEGEVDGFDRRILLALRNPGHPSDPIGPRSFEESMRDMTALGGVTFLTLLTVTATLVLALHGRWRRALIFMGTVLCADLSSEVLKQVYDRPRPDLVPHGSYVYSQSFPSGHSTMAAATYLTLATVVASLEPRRATKVLAYVVAVMVMAFVGFSRVYLGVHWPTDVLAGWCLGTGWAMVAWVLITRFSAPEPVRRA